MRRTLFLAQGLLIFCFAVIQVHAQTLSASWEVLASNGIVPGFAEGIALGLI